jgi:hypothetical protein
MPYQDSVRLAIRFRIKKGWTGSPLREPGRHAENSDFRQRPEAGSQQACPLARAFIDKHHALAKQESIEKHGPGVRILR